MAHAPLLRLVLLVLLALGQARAEGPAAPSSSPSPEAARALLDQQWLPALVQRRTTAEARAKAAEAWFGGDASLGAAFPELDGAPLGDPAFLAGQQLALQHAATERARQRVARPPTGLSEADLARWAAARDTTLDAEERADTLTGRLIDGLRAEIELAPGLREDAVSAAMARFAAVLAQHADLQPTDPDYESAAAESARAGQAQAALRRYQAAGWRMATIPGDGALAALVEADLAAEVFDGLAESALRERLLAARPLLDDALGARVDVRVVELEKAELQRRLVESNVDPTSGFGPFPEDIPGVEAAVSEAQAAVEAAETRLAAVAQPAEGAAADSIEVLRRRSAEAAVQTAKSRLGALQAELDRRRGLSEAAAGTSDLDVAAARAKADQARQAADDAESGGSQAVSVLRNKVAELASKEAQILEDERDRNAAVLADLQAMRERLEKRTNAANDARERPPRDPVRASAVDDAYLELRRSVDEIHDMVIRRGRNRAELAADRERMLSELPEPPSARGAGDSALVEAAAEYARARAGVAAALEQREANATAELDLAIGLLDAAKRDRRRARAEASAQAQHTSRSGWIPEVGMEAREFPLMIGHWWRGAWAWLSAAPGMLTDLNAIWAFLRRSVELIVLLAVWLVLRSRSGSWLDVGLEGWNQGRERKGGLAAARRRSLSSDWLVGGDVRLLGKPAAPVVRRLIDLLVLLVLHNATTEQWPLVGIALLLAAGRVLLRLLPDAIKLALIVPGERRPALRRSTSTFRDNLVWTIRVFVILWIVRAVLSDLALGLLDSDRIQELFGVLTTLAGWALVLVALHRWAAVIRDHLGRREGAERLPGWVLEETKAPVLSVLRASVGLALLIYGAVKSLATRIIEGRGGLSWLGAALARRQLKDTGEVARTSARPQDLQAIRDASPRNPARPKVDEKLRKAWRDWQAEQRRGMVALVGDHGSGRDELCSRIGDLLDSDYLPVHPLPTPPRLQGRDVALEWLLAAVEAPAAADGADGHPVKVAVERVEALSPRIFVLDGLHRAFLRTVGGFDGLRALLAVMHSTSDHHFWVCGVHSLAWSFLEGVPDAANLAIFRDALRLEPSSPAELATWLGERTAQAGMTADFSSLLPARTGAADRDAALERVTTAYWRLLADGSRGNPEGALELWLGSLYAGSAGPAGRTLSVELFEEPDDELLEKLEDAELFVLAALLIHDDLTVDDLHVCQNLGVGTVRGRVRRLEGLTLLLAEGASDAEPSYRVAPAWRPSVERLLRNRHILHR